MGMDWKDMLSQLRDGLPDGDDMKSADASAASADSLSENGETMVAVRNETIHIVLEKKGRKGKTATIAEGFACDDCELEEIASKAKRHLGVGGSARGGEILMQGECRERFAAFLKSLGFKVK